MNSTIWWIIQLGLAGLGTVLLLASLYQFLLGLRGFQGPRPLPRARALRRFAVLIPAHDEAQVIGPLLHSLQAQTYEGEFDVLVCADNCTDATAAVARAHGATVLERHDPQRRGKGWTLRWALGQIGLERYDAVAMLDADNLAHPEFLERMNDYLEAHPEAEAVQGYLDTKNPDDSWVTRAIALAYWHSNRFWQLARQHLGLSGTLGGTGCVIRSRTLRRTGWQPQSLTEDLEYTAMLVLGGGRVHWNDWAVVYDEKPLTLRSSVRQRTRWMQGHFWVLGRYGPRLLRAWLRTRRWQHLDLLLYLASPALMLLNFVGMGLAYVLIAVGEGYSLPGQMGVVASWLGMANAALLTAIAPSLHSGRLVLRYLPALLATVGFGLSWAIPVFSALWLVRDQGRWEKTEHTRAVPLEELRRR
ncbi:glycosyltransferase family 2 protein [Calidithermus terrae]|uniref:glycosyltransferase family 2 protein n=1 Tax=Calidithermus terrae TaxID=1408545 RepID=UPI000E64AD9D|nr:glycosyltransferase family 2 protein [Calidithermus terrae]